MNLRDANPADFPAILALNAESVHFLSPLDPQRLQHLHEQASLHVVAEQQGELAGFLMAVREGADYDSINYCWFAERYAQFLYVDRVVVGVPWQGQGIGRVISTPVPGGATERCGPS
ncbi:MAG: hypothetical protein R3E95_16370 [Thiolinea sp.]